MSTTLAPLPYIDDVKPVTPEDEACERQETLRPPRGEPAAQTPQGMNAGNAAHIFFP